MPTFQQFYRGMLTTEGRLICAIILFGLVWLVKTSRVIRGKMLTSDRIRSLATVVLSLPPAAVLLADPTIPASEAWYTLLLTVLSAMGIQGLSKSLLGPSKARRLTISSTKGFDT